MENIEKLIKQSRLNLELLENEELRQLCEIQFINTDPTIINDEIERCIYKNGETFIKEKSFYNNQGREINLTDLNFQELLKEEDGFGVFKLNAVQSERYFNQTLYEDDQMFDSKTELMSQLNYRVFNIIGEYEYTEMDIKLKPIIDKLKLLKNSTYKNFIEYFLIRSGLYVFPKTEKDKARNHEFLEIFNNPGNYTLNDLRYLNLWDFFRLSFLEDTTDRSFNPFWPTPTKVRKIKRSIGNFAISDAGIICNIFIEKEFRSQQIKDKSILNYIFDGIIKLGRNYKHKILYLTSKNPKIQKKMKDYGFKVMGRTQPPVNLNGYTEPNEIISYLELEDNINITEVLQTYFNATHNHFFTEIEFLDKIRQKMKLPDIIDLDDLNKLNQETLEYILDNKLICENFKYVSVVEEPFLLDTYNMVNVSTKVFYFKFKNEYYKLPLFDKVINGFEFSNLSTDHTWPLVYLRPVEDTCFVLNNELIIHKLIPENLDIIKFSNNNGEVRKPGSVIKIEKIPFELEDPNIGNFISEIDLGLGQKVFYSKIADKTNRKISEYYDHGVSYEFMGSSDLATFYPFKDLLNRVYENYNKGNDLFDIKL